MLQTTYCVVNVFESVLHSRDRMTNLLFLILQSKQGVGNARSGNR